MSQSIRAGGLRNRYSVLIIVLLVMLYVHTRIILIHPLLFIVWPMSVWLIIELYTEWKKDRLRLILFSASFLAYLVATQFLVVEKSGGIFFDLAPFPNMVVISNYLLLEVTILYIYDTFVANRTNYKNTISYVGFASVIPWISPAILETIILLRWTIDGTFSIRTLGKGLGAASLNDILFIYGFNNFLYASIMFYSVVLCIIIAGQVRARQVKRLEKEMLAKKNTNWLINAWENPISLLSKREQEEFSNSYGRLSQEIQKEILRKEILPQKGIRLVDPDSL